MYGTCLVFSLRRLLDSSLLLQGKPRSLKDTLERRFLLPLVSHSLSTLLTDTSRTVDHEKTYMTHTRDPLLA